MSIKTKIQSLIKNPNLVIRNWFVIKLRYLYPDKLYLKLLYYLSHKRKLDLKNPQTFTEKLQWIKLYDHNPYYTKLVDKYESKKIVDGILGEGYEFPLLGVYDRFDDIDFNTLPNQFVIKCTHNCGVVICKDKNKLDIKKARKSINKTMRNNYFYYSREWPYKNVPRKVIVEQYMEDESYEELKDYKFFCFNGEPKLLYVASGRGKDDTRFDFFDTNFNHLDIINGHPNADSPIKKPENFDKMVLIATKLSQGLKEVRIDLYNINGRIYVGEFTFFHMGGIVPFEPIEWDYELGRYVKL